MENIFKVNNNPDGLDEATLAKVNELRQKRNALNDEAGKVQQEIDQIILEHNNFGGLIGKYLEIAYDGSDEVVYCGPITEVSRILSRSCRIKADIGVVSYDGYAAVSDDFDIDISQYDSEAFGKRKTTYKTISKEEFQDAVFGILDKVKAKF